MVTALETTRREWEDGNQRLQAAASDRWVLEALAEHEPAPGWPARATTAQDAAFYLYARGAVDYRP